MLRKITAFFGCLMLAAGLLGFFIPNFLYLVQFDLFQSFIYALLGAVGIKLGFVESTTQNQLRYVNSLAVINLFLMMLGLSWPNLGDILHLEVPEHFFHATVGIVSAFTSSYFSKKI